MPIKLEKISDQLFSRTISLILYLLYKTLKIETHNELLVDLNKKGKPYILGIWHCNTLFSPIIHRNMNIGVMISNSKDGEKIAQVVEKFGNIAIRGSASKGGVGALKKIIRFLRSGRSAAITPDGPLGPYLKVKSGLISMAKMSGVPIIPFHYEATNQWKLIKSWDSHRIPKPFSKIYLSYGNPIHIDSNLDSLAFPEQISYVESRLLENMKYCLEKIAN